MAKNKYTQQIFYFLKRLFMFLKSGLIIRLRLRKELLFKVTFLVLLITLLKSSVRFFKTSPLGLVRTVVENKKTRYKVLR